MKEYGIYIRNGSGTPYMLHFYKNITEAKLAVNDIVSTEKLRNRPYYVDNDYYNNEYPCAVGFLKYICIKEREVSDWSNFSEITNKNLNDSKIIFANFKN